MFGSQMTLTVARNLQKRRVKVEWLTALNFENYVDGVNVWALHDGLQQQKYRQHSD